MPQDPIPSNLGPITVSGSASEEEIAAIVAAIEMSWPQPAPPTNTGPPTTSTRWRYADRWWDEGRLPVGWQ